MGEYTQPYPPMIEPGIVRCNNRRLGQLANTPIQRTSHRHCLPSLPYRFILDDSLFVTNWAKILCGLLVTDFYDKDIAWQAKIIFPCYYWYFWRWRVVVGSKVSNWHFTQLGPHQGRSSQDEILAQFSWKTMAQRAAAQLYSFSTVSVLCPTFADKPNWTVSLICCKGRARTRNYGDFKDKPFPPKSFLA